MTPLALLTYAKQQYNAVNDDFYTDAEMYTHIWAAQNILARECNVIENTYTTSTEASQREYLYPTNAIAIKRMTYDGQKLDLISFDEDDLLTGFLENTTGTGTPTDYVLFDKTIYLRPVPDAIGTLKIYTFDQPSEVSSTSTLDVPDEYHLDMANYLLWKMAAKDQNFQSAAYYEKQWTEAVARCKKWSRKRLRASGNAVVQDVDAKDMRWWRP